MTGQGPSAADWRLAWQSRSQCARLPTGNRPVRTESTVSHRGVSIRIECVRLRTLGAQARQSNATPHIHSSHLACGYAYTPPAKLPGEGGLSLHRSSESWRAGKCDRPCESDGTSDAVASSARTCVEAASQPRDDGTRPSGQHRDLPRFEGMLNQSADVVSDCYTSCSKSIFWSLRSTTSNRGGALNGWIEEVGGCKLGAPRDRFHLWAKPSWRAKPNTSANKHAQARKQLEATKRRKPQS
jgi:hypothetical protein